MYDFIFLLISFLVNNQQYSRYEIVLYQKFEYLNPLVLQAWEFLMTRVRRVGYLFLQNLCNNFSTPYKACTYFIYVKIYIVI